jgi:hypothetical protein
VQEPEGLRAEAGANRGVLGQQTERPGVSAPGAFQPMRDRSAPVNMTCTAANLLVQRGDRHKDHQRGESHQGRPRNGPLPLQLSQEVPRSSAVCLRCLPCAKPSTFALVCRIGVSPPNPNTSLHHGAARQEKYLPLTPNPHSPAEEHYMSAVVRAWKAILARR